MARPSVLVSTGAAFPGSQAHIRGCRCPKGSLVMFPGCMYLLGSTQPWGPATRREPLLPRFWLCDLRSRGSLKGEPRVWGCSQVCPAPRGRALGTTLLTGPGTKCISQTS